MVELVRVCIASLDGEKPLLPSSLVLFLYPHLYDNENVNLVPFEHERTRPFRAAMTIIERYFYFIAVHDTHFPNT